MVTSITLHPEVLWAQRNDVLYLTVNLFDAQEETMDLTADKLTLTARSGGDDKPYAVELLFHAPIVPEESKYVKTGRNFAFVLQKKEPGPYWPRLLKKECGKPHWLKTDFSKWKDEDEDEEQAMDMNGAGGGFDMSQFANFNMGGGMGDMGGMAGGMPGGMDFSSMMANMPEGDSDDDEEQVSAEQKEEEQKE